MCLLILKRGKGGKLNICNIERYLLTYHWKVLVTIETITLSKGFNNIPVQNGGLSKFTSCQTLTCRYFEPG